MNNHFSALATIVSKHITCCYKNETGRLQVIRIANLPNWSFERVVFPQQQLVFHAASEALLEVHSSEVATAILAERIPCTQLRLAEPIEMAPSR